MKILVDENIPRMTVDALRSYGHEVRDLRGTPEQGLTDRALWLVAATEARLLIPTDKGFSEFRSVPPHGILIVRLRQPNRHKSIIALCGHSPNFRNRIGETSSLSCGTRR